MKKKSQIIIKRNDKKSVLNLLIFLTVMLTIFLLIKPIKIESTNSNANGRSFIPTDIILNNTTYSQKVKCNIDNLKAIGIKLSTYTIKNKNGKLKITIKDGENTKIYDDYIFLKDVVDNDILYLYIDEIKKSKGKTFNIIFEYEDYNKGNTLSYWYTKDDIKSNLKINNYKVEEEMLISFLGKNPDCFMAWYPALLSMVLYVILVLIEGDNNEKRKN